MMLFEYFLTPLCITFFLTFGVRYCLLRFKIIDRPTARSSHTVATPRGGGLAIVITYIATVIIGLYQDTIPSAFATAVLCSGGLIAIVGFVDDFVSLPASLRLGVHFIAGGVGLYWMGGFPAISDINDISVLRYFINLVVVVGLVWMLNLYNFMDGINGVASVGVICSTLPMALLYALHHQYAEIAALLLLAGCVAGFVLLNFPRAYIFLGDVGSGFLGMLLGLYIVRAANVDFHYFWAWLILLGVYVCDATLTLVRRLYSGHAPHQPHRTHAYQKAAMHFGSHIPVTLGVAAVMLFWLFPIASMVVIYGVNGPVSVLIAYAPLVGIGLWIKSGVAR